MLVGNIVISSKIIEDNFKICKELDDVDSSLPTLIVGWNKVKELFGDKVSILHKQIDDDNYWTFSEKERKIDYENDVSQFKKLCYDSFGDEVIYVYIDILHNKLSIIKKILNKIYKLEESFSYVNNKNMLYIYGDDIIFGMDLNIIEFIGIEKDKILSRVNALPNSVLIENEIFNKCKEFMKKINNKDKLVPYIIKYGGYS